MTDEMQGRRRRSVVPGWRRYLRFWRSDVEGDVDDELHFHLESRVGELTARGLAPDAARAQALDEFGDVDAVRRRLGAIDRRILQRRSRADWWEAFAQDTRYAARALRKHPGFATTVIVTLALGAGANATMFGIVDRLLLRPPAYLEHAGEVGRVYLTRSTTEGADRTDNNISYKRYTDLRDGTTSFSRTAAFFEMEAVVGTSSDARSLRAVLASASFWPLFGVRPAAGRFFTADEDREPIGSAVAVLGYGYWQSAFGGDRAAIGRALRIGARTYTIIGVAPKGFSGVGMSNIAAFVPITAAASELVGERYYLEHNASWMEMIARRRPGVAAAAASADLTRAYRRSMAEAPRARPLEESRPRAELASVLYDRGPKKGERARVATWLAGVSIAVLLIACANVANLLLARALTRRREIAVRVALGVSRARLVGQLLTESTLLAVLGAAAGLLVAQWGGGVLRSMLLPDVDWSLVPPADTRILLFTGSIALLTGLFTGLAPALQATRTDVNIALKAGGREGGRHRSRTRNALLVFQAALSVVLLVGAGLFVRSLHNVRSLDLGFEPNRVLYVWSDLRGSTVTPAESRALRDRMIERARSMPGVTHASITTTVPFWITIVEDLAVPGIDSVSRLGEFNFNAVSADYFATTGTRVLRGRPILDSDRASSARVIVVSESMARTLWPGREALGQCVKVGADSVPCSEVVGLVQDIRRGDLRNGTMLQYYIPISQSQNRSTGGLYVRTAGNDARAMLEPVRRELQRLVPGMGYVNAKPLQEMVDPEIRPWRLGATMFAIFGGLALAVASLGLYSVAAYGVTQRTHEMGVRLALGARTRDILRLVVSESVRSVLVGVTVGTAIALASAPYVAALLFKVSPREPVIYLLVGAVLTGCAVLASLVPALRASRVDPNTALRAE